MRLRIFHIVLITLLVLSATVISATAKPSRLSGLLEWRYGEHTAEENGTKVLDASHFTQKYSFLWAKDGRLVNGRLGKYDVALGYEWSWVDSYEGNHQKVNIDNPLDKILYNGDITIAPGGLPFNFRVYSRDLHSTSFDYQDLSELFSQPNQNQQGGTITAVTNGTSRLTGATLRVGTSNGHYDGRYRDLLSTLPRLLVDYRQADVHDIRGPYKRDYIDRDLAFVSLNKKNNWFHYRVFSHTDRLDSSEDYQEQTYLLGTIDHQNQRQWVNLTNWIQVSSDISYSEYLPDNQATALHKSYDLNLFTKAQRTRWHGSNFNSFRRLRDADSLDKTLLMPFYAQGELNRDTSWRFRTIVARENRDYFSGLTDNSDDVFVSGRVNTFRQSRYVFSPVFEAETKSGTDGRGASGRLGAEFYSNSSYRSPLDIFGNLDLQYFNGTADSGTDVDYLEVVAGTRIEQQVNAVLLVGGSQRLTLGNGIYNSSVSDNIVSKTNLGSIKDRSTVVRSVTDLYGEYRAFNHLRNRLEGKIDYLSLETDRYAQYIISHHLDYGVNFWDISMSNDFGFGDALPLTTTVTQTPADNYLESIFNVHYSPTRAIESSLRLNYSWRDFKQGQTSTTYNVLETSKYVFWSYSGRIRQLANVGQEFETQQTLTDAISTGDDFTAFTLFGNYYPTYGSLLGARLRYDIDDNLNADTLTCFLTAGLDFQKFKVSIDYSYGQREAGTISPERNEQRWEIKIKKLL